MKHPMYGILAVVLTGVCAGAAYGKPVNECSDTDVRGRYAFLFSGTNVSQVPATPISISGAFRADGHGRITEWTDDVAQGQNGNPFKVVAEDTDVAAVVTGLGHEMRYEVGADCRIEITFTTLTPIGPTDFKLNGAVARRGRELLLQTGAPIFVGTGRAVHTGLQFRAKDRRE